MLYCENPVKVQDFVVPCGKCLLCRTRQRKDWSLRIRLEALYYGRDVLFATLTYDPAHCPSELVYSDFQAFCKRLRRKKDFRFFVAGEYGDRFGRPHFHAIFFGLNLDDIDLIHRCWKNGFVKVSPFTPQRAFYTSGYVQKKMSYVSPVKFSYWLKNKDMSEREEIFPYIYDDFLRCPPMAHMSNRPGLAFNYYFDHRKELYSKGYIQLGQFKYGLPKYFRKMLALDFPDYHDELVSKMQLRDSEKYVAFLKKHPFLDYQDFLNYSGSCISQKLSLLKSKNDVYLKQKIGGL